MFGGLSDINVIANITRYAGNYNETNHTDKANNKIVIDYRADSHYQSKDSNNGSKNNDRYSLFLLFLAQNAIYLGYLFFPALAISIPKIAKVAPENTNKVIEVK